MRREGAASHWEGRMTATTAASAAAGVSQGNEKPWLKSYPPGVPTTIDETKLATLAQMFRDSVRDFADRPAVESFGKRMSYAELGKAADAVASWLQGQGLKAAFLCSDSGWQAAVTGQPPEDRIDKGSV